MNNTVKPSKPPFIAQETPDSCVPACLRMIFAGCGLAVSEDELRALCDCTFLGTEALQAVEAARHFGFTNSAKHTLTINELEALVADECYPIVYLNLAPIDGIQQRHAVVIVAVTAFSFVVLDPAVGERLIPRDVFLVAWKMRHNLAIRVVP